MAVIGIRPVRSRLERTVQWPKLLKLTTARAPILNISRSTSRGRSTACSVRDNTT